MKVTLDRNCIVALDREEEKEGEQAQFVKNVLIPLHHQGKITIQIPLSMAYDNMRAVATSSNEEEEFKKWLGRLGLSSVVILPRIAIVPESKLYPSNQLYPSNEEDVELYLRIINVLFPNIRPENPNWSRRYYDVLVCFAHKKYGGDILITNDNHILRKIDKLKKCGVEGIMSADEKGRRDFCKLLGINQY